MSFSPTGKVVASLTIDGTVTFWVRCEGLKPERVSDPYITADISGGYLAVSNGGKLRVWSLDTTKGTLLGGIDPNGAVTGISYLQFFGGSSSACQTLLIFFQVRGTVVEFDIRSQSILREIHLARRIGSAAVSPSGDVVLHNLKDGLEVFYLDISKSTFICKIPLHTRRRVPTRPFFLPGDFEAVICHTEDGVVRIWHACTGEEMYEFNPRAGKKSFVQQEQCIKIPSTERGRVMAVPTTPNEHLVALCTVLKATGGKHYQIEVWKISRLILRTSPSFRSSSTRIPVGPEVWVIAPTKR
ncbi:WD40 repeat-like protein [Lentinus tigrinus ALCF2SS1-6]|uniref:WD40 repeat-like protein n=1 Tax=Lentinus tigrinus ALCF2SS1-6 TaxID=1328759 RepID=A0A5C2RLD2_9APHY|nr:WD40 repeat-like protein [Lentinus tigrinus ALCF2SS1-6]